MSDPRDRPRVIEEPGRPEPDEPLVHPRVIETDDTGPIDIGPIAMSSGELTPVKQVPPPSGRGLKALAIAGLGLAGMAGVTALWWAISLFEHSLGLGLAGTGFLALAFGGTGYLALHEARAIGRLREVKHLRERFEHTTDRARLREQLLELARELADAPTLAPGIARWRARAGADLPPEDALRTFEAMVLSEADKIAIAAIRRAARDTFGIVAVSPRAAVDIAVFVWRGLKLVREIGEAYGYRPPAPPPSSWRGASLRISASLPRPTSRPMRPRPSSAAACWRKSPPPRPRARSPPGAWLASACSPWNLPVPCRCRRNAGRR